MLTVLRTLLFFAHFFYGLCMLFWKYFLIVQRKFIEIWNGRNIRVEVGTLVQCAVKRKKLPRHLIIVFGQKDDDSIADCVKIVSWCVTLSIPYVSFFDGNGTVMENRNTIESEFAKQRPSLVNRVDWSEPSVSILKNGITESKLRTRVSLLSYTSGSKGEIVESTRHLAKAITAGSIRAEEINDDLLDERFRQRGLYEPDLVLIYGRACSTYGLLPWHTRTTAFFMLPSQGSLSVVEFTRLLERFSRCEQRYDVDDETRLVIHDVWKFRAWTGGDWGRKILLRVTTFKKRHCPTLLGSKQSFVTILSE
ncbi:hypothetical protein KM043_014362 [Ampulex compressa]|nr:hypothetical protein KM043_014362 [Ampulex compressa]